MFGFFFNLALVWAIGICVFIGLGIAAEWVFQVQTWLNGHAPTEADKGCGVDKVLGVSLGLMSPLLSFNLLLSIVIRPIRGYK